MIETAGVGPADTLLVGDTVIDHDTAMSAGTRCCIVSFDSGFPAFPRDRLRGGEWVASDAAGLGAAIEEFTGTPSRPEKSS